MQHRAGPGQLAVGDQVAGMVDRKDKRRSANADASRDCTVAYYRLLARRHPSVVVFFVAVSIKAPLSL
jgi:hypothetical protein